MAKLTLNTITSGFQATSALNSNFDSIEDTFQLNVLYRNNPSGEPNSMQNDLDMNGYNILNLGNATVLASASVTQAISWGTQFDGTGTHTLTAGYSYRITEVSSSSSVTASLLLTAEVTGGWASGQWMAFIQKGAGPIKYVADAGVTINTPETLRSGLQYGRTTLSYRGSDAWYLSGDLETTV